MTRFATITAFSFLCVLTIPAAAQEMPDTTSAWRYFPLSVGDVWEFEGYEDKGIGDFYEQRVVEKEVSINGTLHFGIAWERLSPNGQPLGEAGVGYVRFDTLSTAILVGSGSPPYGIPWGFPLGAPFGSSPEYGECQTGVGGGYGQTVEIGDNAVVTSVKVVSLGNCEIISTFAAGIGFVKYNVLGGYLILRYARVGGVEYGEPFTVGTESGASTPAPTTLDLYPNPARASGAAVVALEQPEEARVEVVDLLGRRVALLYEGTLPAGAQTIHFDTPLPSGLYLVRLTTPHETLTRRLTVTR